MSNLKFYDIIKKPVVSEKSMNQMADKKYTFIVQKEATKVQIKEAVEKLFEGAKVSKVNTVNNDGESTDTTEKIITEESSGTTDIQNENEDVVEESIEEVELPRMNSYTADDNGYCASFDVVKFGSYEQELKAPD